MAIARWRLRTATSGALLLLGSLVLAACSFPGSVKPTVKLGLSAPFEGLYRETGYEALHAVRLAVRQRNEAGGVGDAFLVELVALNDFNEPEEALVQARKMAIDEGVLGVLAGWSPGTADAVAAEYERAGLALLTPQIHAFGGHLALLADREFSDSYQALSGGAAPGENAAWAYAAANQLLDALDAAARAEAGLSGKAPTRADVQMTLTSSYAQ